jgi:hypothetical protein
MKLNKLLKLLYLVMESSQRVNSLYINGMLTLPPIDEELK